MTYKTILVHVNDERRLPALLGAAMELAAKHSAHLIGASVVPPYVISSVTDPQWAIPEYIEAHRDAYRKIEERMKVIFDKETSEKAAPGAFTAEWRSLDAGYDPSIANVLVPLARTADLIVVSQPDHNWNSSNLLDIPDRLATESGRPVLVVPNAPRAPFALKRILIAWNGSREATRAVYDAIPLLQQATDVKVMWIDPRSLNENAGDLPAADLCAALARHGVKCEETASISPQLSDGETLLFEATKFGWDLLVMGCYGHSRMREFILGGTTRHVLKTATLPVLMAH